jgi:hypothetical protein
MKTRGQCGPDEGFHLAIEEAVSSFVDKVEMLDVRLVESTRASLKSGGAREV